MTVTSQSAMALLPRSALLWAFISLSALLCSMVRAGPPSIPVAFCAGVNTGAEFDSIFSTYQSEGLCSTNCTTRSYALAVVKDKLCWCTNYIPNKADQKSVSDCSNPCPGYPDDHCGGSGAWGYLELDTKPSGTALPGGAAPTGKPNPDPAPDPVESSSSSPVDDAVTQPPPVLNLPLTTSKIFVTSNPFDTSSTHSPIVETVTVGGTVQTITQTAPNTPPTSASDDSGETTTTSSSGLGTGAAVGVAVGVISVVLISGLSLWLWWIRRRRNRTEDGEFVSSVRGSSAGMMPSGKGAEVSENRFIPGLEGRNAALNWDPTALPNTQRRSHLMPMDPRLDPFAKGIYSGTQNKSHDSIGSLQDNHDYSRRVHEPPRVLRAMNPDVNDER